MTTNDGCRGGQHRAHGKVFHLPAVTAASTHNEVCIFPRPPRAELFPPVWNSVSLIIQSKAAVREGEMARSWSVALAVSVAVLLPAGTGADLSHASAFVAPAVARLSSLGSPLSQHKLALPHTTRGRRDRLALRCMAQPGTEMKPVDPAWVSGTKTLKATEYYKPLVAGDILESTDQQRGIVVGSYVALAALFVKGCLLLPPMSAAVMVQVVLAIVIGYEFADIGSGVYHWSMDNYGSKNTPVFGTQIEAFQGHHELPWTITYRQVCNNIYKICQATAPFCVGGILFVNNPFVLLWMSTAISFINLSQVPHERSFYMRTHTHFLCGHMRCNSPIRSLTQCSFRRPRVLGLCAPFCSQLSVL